MKLMRNGLLVAAGLLSLSLPAGAVGSASLADTPQFESKTIQLAQRRGSFTDDGYGRMRDTAAGGVGFKKSKKKKPAKVN